MLQRCVAAQLAKDYSRAQLYAAECAEIRKMAKIVLGSEIALERAIIRLETVEQLDEILVQMLPVVNVVKETRGKIEGVIPEIASELGAVDSLLGDTVRETGMIQVPEGEKVLQDEEARKIFEECSVFAEEQIRKRFPELPQVEHNQEAVLEAEGLGLVTAGPLEVASSTEHEAKAEAEGETSTPDPQPQELPSRVFEYIKDHVRQGGKLNVTECAKRLGAQRDAILKAVETLRRERRIILQSGDPLCQAADG